MTIAVDEVLSAPDATQADPVDAYVRELIEKAPPLSDTGMVRLRDLLRSGRPLKTKAGKSA